jgi:hypothetical protein
VGHVGFLYRVGAAHMGQVISSLVFQPPPGGTYDRQCASPDLCLSQLGLTSAPFALCSELGVTRFVKTSLGESIPIIHVESGDADMTAKTLAHRQTAGLNAPPGLKHQDVPQVLFSHANAEDLGMVWAHLNVMAIWFKVTPRDKTAPLRGSAQRYSRSMLWHTTTRATASARACHRRQRCTPT